MICGAKSKTCLLSSALLLWLALASPCLYSLKPEDFSGASREELVQAVIELETILTELDETNKRLQKQLDAAREQQQIAQRQAERAQKRAREAESELQTVKTQLTKARNSLNEAGLSLTNFETDVRRLKWRWGLAGAGIGAVVGAAGGVYIGVQLSF
jgi:DNA repair exonuclease SbcCD ATPase subunit